MMIVQYWKKIRPPVRWMLLFFLGWITLVIALSPKVPAQDLYETNFSYTQSAKLYFHNMRSFYFLSDTYRGFRRHQIKKLRNIKTPLSFVILENVQAEEVYIFPEIDSVWLNASIEFADGTTMILKESDREYYHRLATRFFIHLDNREAILITARNGEMWSVYEDEYLRRGLETVLFDYFRLLGKK
jgi:hypothetical protein